MRRTIDVRANVTTLYRVLECPSSFDANSDIFETVRVSQLSHNNRVVSRMFEESSR